MNTVLFVCSGNTCRSPMAEASFNSLAQSKQCSDKLRGVSAGLHAFSGSPVNERSRMVCFPDGIDLSGHASRPVTAALVEEASLILTMTREHKRELLELFPQSQGKLFTLKEFVGQSGDIRDPLGHGEQVYQAIYREIKETVAILFEKVKQNESCSWK